jgi:predicted extracellular nuclease
MKVANTLRLVVVATLLTAMLGSAEAAVTGVKITEWMYSPVGSPGEFVELTNFGPTVIDFTGWSFDNNSRMAGSESLSGFGTVASGESVVFTEATAAAFSTAWNLSSSVKVIGGSVNSLGQSDEINLYDASNTLVDRLTFNDQGTGTVKSPRTQGVSGEAGSVAAIGANNASLWNLSVLGDSAYQSVGNDIGSPGKAFFDPKEADVPLPSAALLLGSGLLFMGVISRRRQELCPWHLLCRRFAVT